MNEVGLITDDIKAKLKDWYKHHQAKANSIMKSSDNNIIKFESLMHVYAYASKLLNLRYEVDSDDFFRAFSDNYHSIKNNSIPLRSQLLREFHITNALSKDETLEMVVKYWLACGDLYDALVIKINEARMVSDNTLKRIHFKKLIEELVRTSIQNNAKTLENWHDIFDDQFFSDLKIHGNQNTTINIIQVNNFHYPGQSDTEVSNTEETDTEIITPEEGQSLKNKVPNETKENFSRNLIETAKNKKEKHHSLKKGHEAQEKGSSTIRYYYVDKKRKCNKDGVRYKRIDARTVVLVEISP